MNAGCGEEGEEGKMEEMDCIRVTFPGEAIMPKY